MDPPVELGLVAFLISLDSSASPWELCAFLGSQSWTNLSTAPLDTWMQTCGLSMPGGARGAESLTMMDGKTYQHPGFRRLGARALPSLNPRVFIACHLVLPGPGYY